MTITPQEMERLGALRDRLHAAIRRRIQTPGWAGHNDPDGIFAIRFAGVGHPEKIWLECYCFVIGIDRRTYWEGDTLTQCLDQAEPYFDGWIACAEAEDEDETTVQRAVSKAELL